METKIQIAIQDANILIDLVKLEILGKFFSLPYQFLTTNLVLAELYEEQIALFQVFISSGTFRVIDVQPAALSIIQQLSLQDPKPSIQDWSVLHYAKQLNAILMTGDNPLRKVAMAHGIEVCGILRILDELIDARVISESEACTLLKRLRTINRRLPAKECASREDKWCGKK